MEAVIKADVGNAIAVKKSLMPDVKQSEDVKIRIDSKKDNIIINIKSNKISYLQAAVNSYLNLLKALGDVNEIE